MIDHILERIGKKVPTQRKKIEGFFGEYPQARAELAQFLSLYRPFMTQEQISLDMVVDSYLALVSQMLHSRLEFLRTGRYPARSQAVALEEIYRNRSTMQQYMLGLALSYFLWRHQFQLLMFYRQTLENLAGGNRFLEVGCGHGLLLVELMNRTGGDSTIEVVDISRQSLDMTANLLKASFANDRRCAFFHCDIFDFQVEGGYDFISMGEVLEHVERPRELLARLAGLLAPEGRLFVTTCANCPAVDHVYHFEHVEQIREVISQAGLQVEAELTAPSEQKDMGYLVKNRIDISYAATLRRRAGA